MFLPELSGCLANAFQTSHRLACMNDNLDGTLSIVGKYKDKVPGESGFRPAIIVSKGTTSLSEDPIVSPKQGGRVHPRSSSLGGIIKASRSLVQLEIDDSDDSWSYSPPPRSNPRPIREPAKASTESNPPGQQEGKAIEMANLNRRYDQFLGRIILPSPFVAVADNSNLRSGNQPTNGLLGPHSERLRQIK